MIRSASVWTAVAFSLFSSAMAHAQQPDTPPTDEPPLPPLSRECQTPGVTISGEALHNVTNALRLRNVIKILAIGASSMAGKGAMDGGYQSIIETVLEKTIPGTDVQIIDRGISGELAHDAAQRMKNEVALVNPDLVLWQLGTHDALTHVPVEQFKTNVGEAIDWLKEHNVDVVLVGLHYLRKFVRDPHYQAIRAALRATAEDRKVLVIGRYEASQVIEQARKAGVGPSPNEFTMTAAGYACLSEYVVRALTSGTFARQPRLGPPKR